MCDVCHVMTIWLASPSIESFPSYALTTITRYIISDKYLGSGTLRMDDLQPLQVTTLNSRPTQQCKVPVDDIPL